MRHQQQVVTRHLLDFSPRITPQDPERLWLEPVSRSSEHLDAWCIQTLTSLQSYAPVAIGVSSNATTAWAAARSISRGHCIIPPEQAESFLGQAPIEVLDIPGEALDILCSLGIRRVHQLRALDPSSLSLRFGSDVAEARRRAEGWDPRGARKPTLPNIPEVHERFDDDLVHQEALLFRLSHLAQQLLDKLKASSHGALEVELTLWPPDAYASEPAPQTQLCMRVASAITQHRTLLELLRTRLENTSLNHPISACRIRVIRTCAISPTSGELFSSTLSASPANREVALDRIRHRLGPEAVRRASHQERSLLLDRAAWCIQQAPRPGEALPWRRIDPPSQLRRGRVSIAGRTRRLKHLGRTERLSTRWWREHESEVEFLAWAEVEGPLLVLLHGRCSNQREDRWEAVAWVD